MPDADCCGKAIAFQQSIDVLQRQLADARTAIGAVPSAIPVLGVASIFHAGYLLRCIRSIDFAVSKLVVVHNGDDPDVGAAIATLQQERPDMHVVREPVNTGCAGGWNRILAANKSAPWWLIVNDDIAFPPGALRNIASRVWARVEARPAEGHFKFWYQHGATGWSCFALAARAVREVGTFDENIYRVYFEDQDYEWRLERAGLASVHVRDVLVVHGSEAALEYESGSMTALRNGTGASTLRERFTRELIRGDNRAYMRQKWGALKPSADGETEQRWRTPFNRQLPLSWWALDETRRHCIVATTPAAADTNGGVVGGQRACSFNEKLAVTAARARVGGGASRFGQRLSDARGRGPAQRDEL